jgi:hypothetical protein
MYKNLLNLEGINWWTLLGGLGLNLILTLLIATGGTLLAVGDATKDFYQNYGSAVMIAAVFLVCGMNGYIVGKIAEEQPVKHALWASLGAVAPLSFMAVPYLCQEPLRLMLALVAALGALNGGMLSVPKPHYRPPADKR